MREVPMLAVLHAGLARALVLYLAFVGVWGLRAWQQRSGISPSYRGALVIAWLTAVVQGAFGILMWVTGIAPRDELHILYGFALAAALPLGYAYSRNRAPREQSLVTALVALFSAGLAIRGITTS